MNSSITTIPNESSNGYSKVVTPTAEDTVSFENCESSGHPDHGSNTAPNNAEISNSQISSPPKGNGRVYQINQDGRLKLRISLKGLGTRDENNSNTRDYINHEENENGVVDSNDSNNTLLMDTDSIAKNTQTESQQTVQDLNITSQNSFPPDSRSNQISAQAVTTENHISDTFGEFDDSFSDDISLSQIEQGAVETKKLTSAVSVIRTPLKFSIVLKFSEQNKNSLRPEVLNSLTKVQQTTKGKRKTPARKAKQPPKPKPKKRPKLKYSRFMVKMNAGPMNGNGNPTSIVVTPSNSSMKGEEKPELETQASGEKGSCAMDGNGDQPNDEDDDDGLIEQSVRLSLTDPLSGMKMVTPLRSKFCSHVECFDYESFLAMYHLKPFRIAIKRYGMASPNVGDVDIMKLLEDTKRPVMNTKGLNLNSNTFLYKAKMKQLKEKNKDFNELEWFCCPICKAEFNIKRLGDVYVVGEFLDLLQDLQFVEKHESITDVEIDLSSKGSWHWVREEDGNDNISQDAKPRKDNISGALSSGNGIPAANEIVVKDVHHNVEVISIDSDVDDEEAENAIAGGAPSGSAAPANAGSNGLDNAKDTPMSEEPPAQTIMNKLAPLLNGPGNEATEEEMMKQIDELFEAEVFRSKAAGSTLAPGSMPNVNPSPSATPTPNSGVATKIMNPFRFFNPAGTLLHDTNVHKGVVAFRPGAFTEQDRHVKPAAGPGPVFMSGEGAADDPIVLD